ncbi:MAG: glycosyltransferase family 2 protein [Proteobacteria bacterium]|nr:glycosyltransferase family 2 protein [Pseudomonadota bacterium]
MTAGPDLSRLVGVVAIGRNEGERLRRCLASVPAGVARVYVDSGSSDDSVAWAQAQGVAVVALDMRIPFTAARARNAGLERLVAEAPDLRYVQFVDGDSELAPAWLTTAVTHLEAQPEVVAVGGRLRERHPEATLYNRLCDAEWDTPVGEAEAFGGNACLRVAPLRAAGGFRIGLIAGEEPELALRLRRAGGLIHRLPVDMGWHDAAITRLGQWWQRNRRVGHAFAEGAALHGSGPERFCVRATRRALGWGAVLPLTTVVLALAVHPAWLALALAYPLQMLRIARRLPRHDGGLDWARAGLLVLGHVPAAQGVFDYHWRRWRKRSPELIEYK